MSKSQIERINDIFLDKDPYDDRFKEPFVIEKHVYATNAYAVARMKKDNQSFHCYLGVENKQTILDLFDFNKDKGFSINVKQLESAINKIPKINKIIKKSVVCDECDGDGQVLWEYNEYESEFDCPKCDGGEFIDIEVETDELIPDPFYVFRLNEKVFKQNRIKEIIAIAKLLNEPNLKWFTGVKLGCLFQIKDVELIVMECVNPSKKIINIKS